VTVVQQGQLCGSSSIKEDIGAVVQLSNLCGISSTKNIMGQKFN